MKEEIRSALSILRQAFADLWSDMWTALVCHLIWLVAQILIVTGPPATIALFYFAQKMAAGEQADLSDFWGAFRRYWGIAWRWGIINILILSVLVGDYLLVGGIQQRSTSHLVQGFYLSALVFWLLLQVFSIPFLFLQEQPSVQQAYRNGMVLIGRNLVFTLILGLFLGIFLLLGVVVFMLTFAFGAMLVALAGNRAVLNRLEAYLA